MQMHIQSKWHISHTQLHSSNPYKDIFHMHTLITHTETYIKNTYIHHTYTAIKHRYTWIYSRQQEQYCTHTHIWVKLPRSSVLLFWASLNSDVQTRVGTPHKILRCLRSRGGHRIFQLRLSTQMFKLGWGHRTNF